MNEANNLQISTQPPLVIADVSRCPSIRFINGDSLEILKSFSDNEFDLGLIDPPYGIDFNYNEYQDTEDNLIEIINKAVPELRRVCKRVLIFGNHKKNMAIPKT